MSSSNKRQIGSTLMLPSLSGTLLFQGLLPVLLHSSTKPILIHENIASTKDMSFPKQSSDTTCPVPSLASIKLSLAWVFHSSHRTLQKPGCAENSSSLSACSFPPKSGCPHYHVSGSGEVVCIHICFSVHSSLNNVEKMMLGRGMIQKETEVTDELCLGSQGGYYWSFVKNMQSKIASPFGSWPRHLVCWCDDTVTWIWRV